MKIAKLIVSGSLLPSVLVFAQVASNYDGDYNFVATSDSKKYEGTLHLSGDSGTFKRGKMGRGDACGAKDIPAKVVSATSEELVVFIDQSVVVPECNKITWHLKANPDGTFIAQNPDSPWVIRMSKN